LQSQEFVARLSSEKTKLTELGAEFVPGFQGPLTLIKQHLVFSACRCLYGELVTHGFSFFGYSWLLLLLISMHFLHQNSKP